MSRRVLAWIACVAVTALAGLPIARADGGADPSQSVLVTLTRLQQGTLPHVVVGYGTIGAANSGRQTVMAPESAMIGEIFVRLGEQVPAGAPLVRLSPSPASAAAYMQAKSALTVAQQLVASTNKLVALHLATAQELASARKSQSDARSQLRALQMVGAAGPKVIRAPFPAIVTALTTTPGALVAEGAPLLDLAAPGRLVLTVGVVPAQAADVAPNDPAVVTLVGSNVSASGTVMVRGSFAQAASGLVPVDVALPPGKFFPGEMAEAAITTGELHGYLVPHAAILVGDNGAPYVVQAIGGVAKKVPVKVLGAHNDRDVISGALDSRAPLVLTGNYQLDNGMKIRLADPPAAKGAR